LWLFPQSIQTYLSPGGGSIFGFASENKVVLKDYFYRFPNGQLRNYFPVGNTIQFAKLATRSNGSLLAISNSFHSFRPVNLEIRGADSFGYLKSGIYVHDSFGMYTFIGSTVYNSGINKSQIRTNYRNYKDYGGLGSYFDSFHLVPRGLFSSQISFPFFDNNSGFANKRQFYNANNTGLVTGEILSYRRLKDFSFRFLYFETDLITHQLNSSDKIDEAFKVNIVVFDHIRGIDKIKAKLQFDIKDYLADSVKLNPLYTNYAYPVDEAHLSRRGDKIIAHFSIRSYVLFKPLVYISNYATVIFKILDTSIQIEKIVWASPYYTPSILNKAGQYTSAPSRFLVGLSDSFYYSFGGTFRLDESGAYLPDGQIFFKTNLYTDEVLRTRVIDPSSLERLYLNPFGGLSSIVNEDIGYTIFGHRSHDNINEVLLDTAIGVNGTGLGDGNQIGEQFLNYIHLNKKVAYNPCGIDISIENKTKKGIGIDKYIWYYTTDSTWSSYDSLLGIEMDQTKHFYVNIPPRNGYFNFRLKAIDTKGGYSEWYEDTIHLNSPPFLNRVLVSDTPTLKYASIVNANTAQIAWHGHTKAYNYKLYRNGTLLATIKDTIYNDILAQAINAPYVYHIVIEDTCGNLSSASNIGQLIILKGAMNYASGNLVPTAELNWNPYKKFTAGLAQNELQSRYLNDQQVNTEIMAQPTSFIDKTFFNELQNGKCYKIIAVGNDNFTSISNEVCLQYDPIVWVPTGISINNDGLNDKFSFTALGFDAFEMRLYNRWGNMVYKTNKAGEQDFPGLEDIAGVYAYALEGHRKGESFKFSGTISIIR
jgi:hypothetical protein